MRRSLFGKYRNMLEHFYFHNMQNCVLNNEIALTIFIGCVLVKIFIFPRIFSILNCQKFEKMLDVNEKYILILICSRLKIRRMFSSTTVWACSIFVAFNKNPCTTFFQVFQVTHKWQMVPDSWNIASREFSTWNGLPKPVLIGFAYFKIDQM